MTIAEWQMIADMVVAGGKAADTGGRGMMQAAQCIVLIQQQIAALNAAGAKNNIMLQQDTNGHDQQAHRMECGTT